MTTHDILKPLHPFLKKYGPWALVAGASEGLGAAFCQALAKMGFNLVIVARRENLLQSLASQYKAEWGIEVKCIAADLAQPNAIERIGKDTKDIPIGLLVYNAAFAPIGPVAQTSLEQLLMVVDTNVRGPVGLVHTLLPSLKEHKGGVILMSSLAGNQGSPRIATYSASKGFNSIWGQGLWHELQPLGIDVTVCCAGAIRTPGYEKAENKEAPGTLDAITVASAALNALGKKPFIIPGGTNKIAAFVMNRILPRKWAIKLMASATQNLKHS